MPAIETVLLKDIEDNDLSANEEDAVTFSKLQDFQRQYGLLEIPSLKRLESGKFRIISGRHRIRSWGALGNKDITAIITDKDFQCPEEEFNVVNGMNTVRGTIQKRKLTKIIQEKKLDPSKLDVFKFPTRFLVPSLKGEDLLKPNEELQRKAKINQLALEIAAIISKTLHDEKDELLTFIVVKDAPAAIIRLPLKNSSEARQKAPDIKEKIAKALELPDAI